MKRRLFGTTFENKLTQDVSAIDNVSHSSLPSFIEPKTLLDTSVQKKTAMTQDQLRVNDHVVIVSAGLEHQKQLFELVYKNVFEQPSCIGKVSGFFTKRNYGTILLFTLFMIKFIYPEVSLFFLGVAAPLVAFFCALLFKLFYLHIVMADLHDIALSYINPHRKNLWVALDERTNEVVGSIAITFHSSFPQRAQLKRMFVTPNYRGQNIAKSLLDVACSFSINHGFTSLFLITTSDHRAAMSLYYKTGFSLFKQWPLWSFRGWFKVSNVYLIKNLKLLEQQVCDVTSHDDVTEMTQVSNGLLTSAADATNNGSTNEEGNNPDEQQDVSNHKCNNWSLLRELSSSANDRLDGNTNGNAACCNDQNCNINMGSNNDDYDSLHCRRPVTKASFYKS